MKSVSEILLLGTTMIFLLCASCAEDPLNSEEVSFVSFNRTIVPNDLIDVNNDKIPDFELSVLKDSTFEFFNGDIVYVEMTGLNGNLIVTDTQSLSDNEFNYRAFVKSLPKRTLVGPSSNIWTNNAVLAYRGTFNFQNISKGILGKGGVYIGIAFEIDERIHYGYLFLESNEIDEFQLIEGAFHQKPTLNVEVGNR